MNRRKDYVRHVRKFATFLGRSPDTATSEDLRRYQLHMAQQQVSPWSINSAIAALRFFFIVTLERPDLVRPLRLVTEPRKTPIVLSQEEVARLIEAAPGLKYKAARRMRSPRYGRDEDADGRIVSLLRKRLGPEDFGFYAVSGGQRRRCLEGKVRE